MFEDNFNPFVGSEALSEYVSRYRRSDLPPLEISRPLDLFPSRLIAKDFNPQLTWADPWPFGDRPGVYMLYGEDFELLYIGKASMKRCLGNRLWEYFGCSSSCVPKMEWLKPVRFVINIAVPKGMEFEAPAIEEFLIKRLKPKSNGTGK